MTLGESRANFPHPVRYPLPFSRELTDSALVTRQEDIWTSRPVYGFVMAREAIT
jgi:hypothetical protein